MLQGVMVDDLTNGFLKVATDPAGGQVLATNLREFLHDVRNRLNSLKIGMYLARRSVNDLQNGLWSELDQTYRGLEQMVDRVQTVCRTPEITPISSDLGPWFEERRQVWMLWLDSGGRRLELAPPQKPATGYFDPWRLLQALDALISWRANDDRLGDRARLAWESDQTHFCIEWSENSFHFTKALEGGDGRSVSLALPLLAHVMQAHGGSVSVEASGDLVIRIRWPRQAGMSCPQRASDSQSLPGVSSSP